MPDLAQNGQRPIRVVAVVEIPIGRDCSTEHEYDRPTKFTHAWERSAADEVPARIPGLGPNRRAGFRLEQRTGPDDGLPFI